MAFINNDKKFYQKNRLDVAIDEFAKLEKPGLADLNKVEVTAQVQAGLNAYRAQAKHMTQKELEEEQHASRLMGEFMVASGDPRPHSLCDAHAIISGRHTGAARVRAVLAWFQRRIDDPINGCWLPRNTAAKQHMPRRLRNAVAHSRIHRKGYYMWLQNFINVTTVKTEQQLEGALKMAQLKLQSSTFPDYVMLPAYKEKP